MNITGFTQGSTYSITYSGKYNRSKNRVQKDITAILDEVDKSLSVYNESSVISAINRNEEVKTTPMFNQVFSLSMKISAETDGAFDITVMPLVKAWGFGPDRKKSFERSKLDSLLDLVGFRKVRLENNRVIKDKPGMKLDVNAIAQGYTVDVICRYFEKHHVRNYLVEVGGEVRAAGTKNGNPWRIGIDKPVDNNILPGNDPEAVVLLTDKALATSGNYRKFYVEDGVKYSHEINPITGYPARNRLLSASIVADDCATADAIATACMVMGLEKSIEFLGKRPDLQGYLVYGDEKGDFKTWTSDSLKGNIEE